MKKLIKLFRKKSFFKKGKIISNIFPFVLICLVVLAFFWKFFFKGLIPIPADFIVGVYYPWLDYKWGFPTGVPVKNPLLADIPSLIYPLKSLLADLLHQKELPLWNPLQFGGYPLLANFQSGVLNPTNLLYLIFDKSRAWAVQTILQPLLAAIFTYAFLRNLKRSKFASIFGAVIFAFSGFSMIWLEYNTHGYVIALIPLLLLSLDQWLRKEKNKWGLLLSIALALQIFMGYPQVTLYSLALLLFFFWLRVNFKIFDSGSLKKLLKVIGWLVLGLGLGAIQLVPGWELLSLSQRMQEGVSGGFEVTFLPWKQMISLIAPDFFGNPATYNYWGPGNYTNNVGYSGLVGLILAFLVMFRKNRDKVISFFGVLFLISIIFALPTPLSKLIMRLPFLGLGAATATKILCLANFSIAVLTAFSVDYFDQWKKEKSFFRIPSLFALAIIGLFLGVFLSRKIFLNYIADFPEGPGKSYLYFWAVNLKVSLRNLILPLALSLATFFATLAVRFRIPRKIIISGIFLLLTFELFRFGWKYNPFTEKKIIFPSTPVLEFLQNQARPVRISTGDTIPISMWMAYGLESASGYDAVYPKRWAQFLSAINGGGINSPMGRYGAVENFGSNLFDLTNSCYVLALKRSEIDAPDLKGKPGYLFRLEKFKKVFEEGTVEILENQRCVPRAFLVNRYRVETEIEKTISLLRSSDFDLRKEILLEVEPIGIEIGEKSNEAKITWLEYLSMKELLQVESESGGFLFVSDSFYPGWKAFVDDQESKIFRANFVFRAVFVPEGKHKVRFIYDPLSFKIGSGVSLASLLILGGILIHDIKNRRRTSL